jgi:hypothetical protein
MISSEVQRTLVKSPPELWAELSDPATLARHLGELGEIRITHIEPEKSVAWEAEDITGTVLIKPSGWGTKVTLTVTREIPEPSPEILEPEAPSEHGPPADPTPAAEATPTTEAEHQPPVEAGRALEPAPAGQPSASEVTAETSEPPLEPGPSLEPEPRPGFFSRLFRRSPRTALVSEPQDPITPSPSEPSDASITAEHLHDPVWAIVTPAPTREAPPAPEALSEAMAPPAPPSATPKSPHIVETIRIGEPADHSESTESDPPDIAAELRAAEEVAAEHVTAVLTGVLDRLGAAHHRPFSRS